MPTPEQIPLELLQTFVRLAERGGDATAAAGELEISQPTISKRLAALRRLATEHDRQPWLLLKGKRWQLTAEGERVRGAVTDIVRRHEQLQRFIQGEHASQALVSIACGQQAATGYVKTATEAFLRQHPECRLRLSTPRGRTRIEGVAGGEFDLALVTDPPPTILRVARTELYIETLFEDGLILVANPPPKAAWARLWNSLPADRAVSAKELLGLPFIVPEADSFRRQQMDAWMHRATGQLLHVVLETGGWRTIQEFAAAGVGVGLVSRSSAATIERFPKGKLTERQLSSKDFPPDAVRLIARKIHGQPQPELTEHAAAWLAQLRQTLA